MYVVYFPCFNLYGANLCFDVGTDIVIKHWSMPDSCDVLLFVNVVPKVSVMSYVLFPF